MIFYVLHQDANYLHTYQISFKSMSSGFGAYWEQTNKHKSFLFKIHIKRLNSCNKTVSSLKRQVNSLYLTNKSTFYIWIKSAIILTMKLILPAIPKSHSRSRIPWRHSQCQCGSKKHVIPILATSHHASRLTTLIGLLTFENIYFAV